MHSNLIIIFIFLNSENSKQYQQCWRGMQIPEGIKELTATSQPRNDVVCLHDEMASAIEFGHGHVEGSFTTNKLRPRHLQADVSSIEPNWRKYHSKVMLQDEQNAWCWRSISEF